MELNKKIENKEELIKLLIASLKNENVCAHKDCENEIHTSKAGNKMDTCKLHLSGFFDTGIPFKKEYLEEVVNNQKAKMRADNMGDILIGFNQIEEDLEFELEKSIIDIELSESGW